MGRISELAALRGDSRIVYGIIAVAAVVELGVLGLTDFTLGNISALSAVGVFTWIWISGLLAGRYGFARLGNVLKGMALVLIMGSLTVIGTGYLAAASGPFADSSLAAADRALGFDWLALFRIYQGNPWLLAPTRQAYISFHWQMIIVPALLFYLKQDRRAWLFLTAWAAASLLTSLTFPFFPAAGPYVHYGLTPDDLPGLFITFPWLTGPLIEGLRSGEIRELGDVIAGGLVSFPSFHTAAAILFAWALWPVKWVRYPALILNVAMIGATLIRGSHYAIDLIGGGLVAIMAIWAAHSALRCSRDPSQPMYPQAV